MQNNNFKDLQDSTFWKKRAYTEEIDRLGFAMQSDDQCLIHIDGRFYTIVLCLFIP